MFEIGDIVALIGHIAGFLQAFCISLIRAISSGDHSELVTIILQLAAIYFALVVIHRSMRMIWGILWVVIQLTIVSMVLSMGLYIYQNGIGDLCDTLWSVLPRGTRLAVQQARLYAENFVGQQL